MKILKKIIPAVFSVFIMAVIFSRLDLKALQTAFIEINVPMMLLALLFFIPQILLFALRWKWMVRPKADIPLAESFRLLLASTTMNLFLPSKLGDLSKAYFIKNSYQVPLSRGLNLAFLEKYLDMLSIFLIVIPAALFLKEPKIVLLACLGITGLAALVTFPFLFRKLAPAFRPDSFAAKLFGFLGEMAVYFRETGFFSAQMTGILFLSLFTWFLQIFQFYLMFLAFDSVIPFEVLFSRIPFVILAGVLPVTIAGIGTRDTALLYMLKGYETDVVLAGVGVLASIRYLLPSFAGLPFLNRYLFKPETPSRNS